MAFRRIWGLYQEATLNDRYDLVGYTAAMFSYMVMFGSEKKPYTTVFNGTVAGILWPVAIPLMLTTKVWQENKSMIIAKHQHKHKKELWVDDFLIDLDE